MSVERHYEREFVRTFFTSPTAVKGEDDSAKMLRSAAQLRGMQAPDVWVPDNEDATAPNMRDEGARNIAEVVAEGGADFPGEIHPRVVWHRDSPGTRYRGFQHMLEIADPENGAVEHIDGFVIPEVGDLDVACGFDDPWHYRVAASGYDTSVVDATGTDLSAPPVVVDLAANTATVTVSKATVSDLDVATTEVVPVVGSENYGVFRDVLVDATSYEFGGARSGAEANAPRVVDLVTPEGVLQSDALAYDGTTLASLPFAPL